MIQYNQIIFSGALVNPNIFRLGLIRAFSDAWFAQNNVLTELNSANSAVHFWFATIFQCFNFVRFCSNSKLKLSHGRNLQWCKPFLDIFFHLREISKQTLENIEKTALILSSESVNILIRGVVAAVRVVKMTPKALLLFSLCIYNKLFPLRFHFYTLLKLQLNCDSRFHQFPDRNNFRFNFSTTFKFQNAVKNNESVCLGM